VILVHGLATNRYDIDFPDPRLSLARYLFKKGFDVWVIELRGAGKSYQRNLLRRYLNFRYRWTFDDHVFKDLPVLVSHIQKATGAKKLHWVGHSLGGTLIYAAIETLGNGVCASGVTIGAAMSAEARSGIIKFLLRLDLLYKSIPALPVKTVAKALLPFSRQVIPLEDNYYFSADNMDPQTLRTAMKMALENVSTTLFLQMHDWYRKDHFTSLDGFSFRDHLKDIKAPFLVCAGSVDGLTPSPDVHTAFRRISSKDKKFIEFGKEQGSRTEYGHVDLILGKNAPREVYPVIADWLIRHDKKKSG